MSTPGDSRICDFCRDEPATSRCSGCQKSWYCSKKCQTDHWTFHIFECNPHARRHPIPTMYHLAFAVYADELPADTRTLREWGFSKAEMIDEQAPFELFGLYIGLIKILGVKPQVLNRWRVQGRLIEEIKSIFEAMPRDARGLYYPWFLQHQVVLENLP
ncbi:hypothetical protein BC629DRAFT_1510255 [Irpex lacteus]|nr:hypothetical protein BC629DRAFT_1510255 [Irpex lacteus]